MKILINTNYGGFSLSEAVYEKLNIPWDGYGFLQNEDLGIDSEDYYAYRADERLIAVVEELGLEKSGRGSDLGIVEIPDDCTCWYIDNYDGAETVRECHRSWS